MKTPLIISKQFGLILLTVSVGFATACRKKKSGDDSTDIEGIGAIPVVVSGDQPVTGNGQVNVGSGGQVILTDDDGSSGGELGATTSLVELGVDQKAHTETVIKAMKIADVGTHPTYLWTKVSGPGNVAFTDATAVPTSASADADGVYVIRLTATYADGRVGSDDVSLLWDTQAPSVNVGADTSRKAAYQHLATTSDAAPFASVALTHTWTKVSGPGTVTFNPANDKDSTISTSQDGTYVLRLTATDSAGNSASDEVTLTWDTVVPASVNAGIDVIVNASTTLTATATDLNSMTYAWTKVSGPGTVTFGSASALATTVSVNQDGTYVLRFTATDAAGNVTTDDLQMIWDTTDPSVNAGTDKQAKVQVSQDATVTDATNITYQWSQVSGPGTLSFGSATAQDTTISANQSGTYVARLVATDAMGNNASDDMTLTWDVDAPSVNAGSDSVSGSSISANATVTDLTALTYQWSKVSGPGTVTFGTATAEDTTISVSLDGVYVIRLTATDALANVASDDLTYELDTNAPSVNAGADRITSAQVSQNATVTGTGPFTYQWSKDSGPGTLTFGSATSEDTTISANTEGYYQVRLTATNVSLSSAFDVIDFYWDQSAPTVNAGADKNVNTSTPLTATASDLTAMTYSWTKQSGPGTVTFGTSTALTTTASASLAGTYVIRFTATDAVGQSSFDELTFVWDVTVPSVDAGTDKLSASSVSQNATVTDANSVTFQWSKTSGPGTLTFGTGTAEDTTISASTDGVYIVRLTATDAAGNVAFDELSYTFDATAPVNNAGTDKAVSASTLQDATVTDLTAITYSWAQTSGPGTLAFGTPTAQDTTISASLYGVYTARLTSTDAAGNASTDDITFKWIRFSLGWSFDTPADYTYDNAKISISGGAASLIPVALASAVDSTSGNFNAGTHGNTVYSGTGVQLDAAGLTAKTGTFTSRIMDAGAAVNWDNISWTADKPYQKDLPDNAAVETTFDSGNVDMTGNVLLLHLNETSTTSFVDSSGNGNNGACTQCPTVNQSGMIGKAPTMASSFISIPVSNSLRLTGSVTFALWIYPTTLSSYQYFFERGANDVDNYAFVTDGNKLAIEFVDQNNTYQYFTSSTGNLVVNQWQHVAAVLDDTGDTLKFYVNGVQLGTTVTMPYYFKSTMNDALWIGRQNFTTNNFYWPGKLDEIGIWTRAFTQADITKLYERGAMSVKFQARACGDATCSLNPAYIGSDGTNATFFDNYPVFGQGAAWAMTGLTGMQYIQYKATLATYSASVSPIVKTVSFAKFLNTAPDLTTNNGYPYTSLVGFDMAVGTGHLGMMYYQLSPDGTNWYWHNGTTWTAAQTSPALVSQANTQIQVNSKISTFHSVAGAGTLKVRAFLNATGGAETIDLKDVIVTGDNAGL